MAIITDPDDLDRWQVVIDPVDQRIWLRAVGDARFSAPRTNGSPADNGSVLTSAGSNFTTDGVQIGDLLVVNSGNNIGIFNVSAVGTTTVTVSETFKNLASADTNVTFWIFDPTDQVLTTGGARTSVQDGVTMQALYSFLKEEWRTDGANLPILLKSKFPMEPITRESFEMGGGTNGVRGDWAFEDGTSRNLIRTAGWTEYSGTTPFRVRGIYAGAITLGELDDDSQVYYQQAALSSTGSTIATGETQNFVLPGAVNQAIQVYSDANADGSADYDYRGYLRLFVRKRARSYDTSQLSDIGVVSLEPIANRFPLSHIVDAAITSTDGEVNGTSPFQTTASVDSGTTDGTISSGTSTTATFTSTGVGTAAKVGDTLQITNGVTANQGYFEVIATSAPDAITIARTPGSGSFSNEGSLTWSLLSPVRVTATDGVATSWDAGTTGDFDSASVADWTAVATASTDYLRIRTNGTGANLIGIFPITAVTSGNITVDVTDLEGYAVSNGTGITFDVLRPGMRLQYKSITATTAANQTLTFANANPDTITRAAGSWDTDGFEDGMVITITNAASANNGRKFTIASHTTTVLTLVAADAVTAEGSAAGYTVTGDLGFRRAPISGGALYSYNWRLIGNNGTLSQCFQFIQRQLRRGHDGYTDTRDDIDLGAGTFPGDVTDLLMQFATPTGTGLNLWIDGLNSSDINNAAFLDDSGTSRNFPFIAGVVVNVGANLTASAETSARLVVFFSDADGTPSNGDEFDTPGAIVVDDDQGVDMAVAVAGPLASQYTFNFDYENNAQGGRTPNTDASVTIVAIGLTNGQYVQTTGLIQKQNANVFSLQAPLERVYST